MKRKSGSLKMPQKCRLLCDQKVEVRSLQNILITFIVNLFSTKSTTGDSTQTWHSLNADKDVLATKRSSTISTAITITVTCCGLPISCLRDLLLCIRCTNERCDVTLIYDLIQVQNLSTPYTVNTFHTYICLNNI